MSDISKIKYSDGTIYNIKDANVRNALDVSKGTYNSIGERMGAYADASDVATAYLDYLQHPSVAEPEFRLTNSAGGICRPCMTYNEFNSWSEKTWNGLTNFNGSHIWTDGENIYYSNGSNHYVLDKSTSTWSTKSWTGLTSFYGNNVWTNDENVYYSYGSNQYILSGENE